MQSVLQIKNVKKSFSPEKQILNDISFSLGEGEIYGLIGLNGAGKTTLIKIILDLLEADAGEVNLFGQSSIDYNSRRNTYYLPEKFQPSSYLTGMEFLEISLMFFNRKVDVAYAEAMAQRLDLDSPSLYKPIRSYSKGMAQKVGLMSCFLSQANLLILDEPMSGLDPKARIKIKELIMEYRDLGKSIFFSSHILADVDEICDNIGILDQGKIVFKGKTEELKSRHQETSLEKAFLKSISSKINLDAS